MQLLEKSNKYDLSSIDDTKFNYALRYAVTHGYVQATRQLLKCEHDISSEVFVDACGRGNIEIAELLLADHRVNPNEYIGSLYASSGIESAVFCGHIKVVKLLLNDSRVDPNIRNGGALIIAAESGRANIIACFAADKRVIGKDHALAVALKQHDAMSVEVLLNAGVKLTERKFLHYLTGFEKRKNIFTGIKSTVENHAECIAVILNYFHINLEFYLSVKLRISKEVNRVLIRHMVRYYWAAREICQNNLNMDLLKLLL